MAGCKRRKPNEAKRLISILLPPVLPNCYKPRMAAKLTIGFLGTGKMATALASGFIRAGLVAPKQVFGSDPFPEARLAFGKATGARIVNGNVKVAEQASVLILATKPDQVAAAL